MLLQPLPPLLPHLFLLCPLLLPHLLLLYLLLHPIPYSPVDIGWRGVNDGAIASEGARGLRSLGPSSGRPDIDLVRALVAVVADALVDGSSRADGMDAVVLAAVGDCQCCLTSAALVAAIADALVDGSSRADGRERRCGII